MKPYYQGGLITVYLADCMDFLAEQSDRSFQLAIVDPPYGLNAPAMSMGSNATRSGDGYPALSTAQRLKKGRLNHGKGKLKGRFLNQSTIDWDNAPPTPEYFRQLERVTDNRIIFGGNYFDLPPTRGVVCWDKVQPWDNFSQWEMAWTSFDTPAKLFRYSNKGGANLEKKIHPTQKPEPLYRWLLHNYAKAGDTILDTHGGSLSIAIACHDLGYPLTVCEIDEAQLELSCKRLEQHQRQTVLFPIQAA